MWALGVAGVLAVGAALYVVLTSAGDGPDTGAAGPPRNTGFVFEAPRVDVTALAGRPSAASFEDDVERIRAMLSQFYDLAFLDPDSWPEGPPADVWDAFTPEAARRAKADPLALTLGPQPRLESLKSDDAALSLDILFDTRKRPYAVIAGVTFDAAGFLGDGSPVTVRSEAEFLLRLVDGRWLVAGFPSAKVKVDSEPPPSPEPSAT
ncbi:MAG: hypothetical protein ABR518_01115, partial [Actinomycetota bacterium]